MRQRHAMARQVAAALTALSTAVGAAFPAAAQSAFTKDECKFIAGVAISTVKAVGSDKLSVDFRQSFVNWLGPNITCDGPREIVIRTGTDTDVMNAIRDGLSASSLRMDLTQRAGFRFVRPEGP